LGTRKKRSREVKIIFQPIKEVVILDYFEFSKDTLSQMFATMIQTGLPIMGHWAEGVLFVHFTLTPETNDLMESYLKGRIFWSSVNFAPMPNYSPFIKITGIEIPVLDVSRHPVLCQVAKWLKNQTKSE
jgi:hypothetical protein